MTATSANVTGAIYATSGKFGNGTNKISIGTNGSNANSAIYSGSKSSLNSANTGFYIGTDGISFGKYANSKNPFQITNAGAVTATNITISGGSFNINDVFTVTTGGVMTATGATVTGTLNATAGDFGGGTNKIHVGKNGTSDVNSAIYSGSKSTFSSNNAGFYIGTDGISLGAAVDNVNPFQVDTTGAVTANNISITGGTLNINNGAFSVTNQGVLSATGATISGTLTAGSGSTIGG